MNLAYLATTAQFVLTETGTIARIPSDATDDTSREVLATGVRCALPQPDIRPREVAQMGTVKRRFLTYLDGQHQAQPGYRFLHNSQDYHIEAVVALAGDIYQLDLELDG